MKSRRFASAFLAFVLAALLASGAIAELANGASMTEEEIAILIKSLDNCSWDQLVEINNRIQLLLFKQAYNANIDSIQVPPGEYIVGEDIPAGAYRIVISKRDKSAKSYIDICPPDNISNSRLYFLDGTDSPEIGKVLLTEGSAVEINGTPLNFFLYTGLFL